MYRDGKVTKFGWNVIEGLVIFFLIIGFAMYMESHKAKGTDFSSVYALLVGLAGIYGRQAWQHRQAERNEEILHDQNKVLNHIETQVNGGTTALLNGMREDHEKAMSFMREQWRVERHDLLGKLNASELRVEDLRARVIEAQQIAKDLALAAKDKNV